MNLRKANLENARRNCCGFTLLEVLLAMSLSMMLLAALYTAIQLHLKFAQRGPEQVRRMQLARAIVARIARDVRAIVPYSAPPDQSSSSTTADSAATGATTSTTTSTGSATTGGTGSTTATTETDASLTSDQTIFGVLGGTDWLQFYIGESLPNLDDTELAMSSGSVAQVSNIQRITYALTVLNTQQDAQGRIQRLALVRSQVAAVGAERLDSGGDDADFRATTEYLCDNLAMVQFQYWDDYSGTWLDSWGVDIPIAPPRAIKVFISLLTPDEYLESELGLAGSQSTWQPNYQLIIPVPAWSPDVETGSMGSETTGG